MKHLKNAPEINEADGSAPTGATIVERLGRGVLRLTGKDPVGMLNAILTNDVPPEPDRGAYALLLNPKGRVQTDLRVLKAGGDILIDAEPEGAEAAREILDRYAPFSRVKIEDLSGSWVVLGLYGPGAQDLLGERNLAEHQTAPVDVGGASAMVVGVSVPIPGCDLILRTEDLASVRDHLVGLGATPADPRAYETARITAGIPRFGADITPENFPGEAGVLDRAVSFQKGCYPGQETVARMRYRGHPNKTLHRLVVEGGTPGAGATISQDDKQVGTITSVAPARTGGTTPALGYLSRKADIGSPLATEESKIRVLGEIP